MNGLAPGWFDFQVGSLLSVLDDELGLGDQTFLLLSADHGPERPWPSGPTDAELNNMGRTAPGASGDKHTILEGGLLVPFLLRWRGAPAGTSTACATSHLDLLPTIAALAGVDVSTYSHVTTDTPPPRSPISPRPLAAAGLPRLDGGVQRLWLDGGGAAAGCTPRSREGPPLLHHSKDVLSVHSSSLKLWVFTRAGLPSAGGGAAEAQLWHAAIEAAAAEKAGPSHIPQNAPPGPATMAGLPATAPRPAGSRWAPGGAVVVHGGVRMKWLLFNLTADPAEAEPLPLSSGSEARREAVRLYAHLDAWLRENIELQPEKTTRARELKSFRGLPSLVEAAGKKARARGTQARGPRPGRAGPGPHLSFA
mmetsp:Transcript_26180/g.78128  ORF Transcript_26180/g.78128 Transcript_26180/m.78128 type:complete len:365 (-) Transcript_26180:128-1222(-)